MLGESNEPSSTASVEEKSSDCDEAAVDRFVNISKKIYEQFINEPGFSEQVFNRVASESGCRLVVEDCDSVKTPTSQTFGQRKPRKEYFLKVRGSLAQFEKAKAILNSVLKINDGGERVSLKMDVSFSDHSFIIGRGGRGIQTVMKDTKCHIHFPDSNRNHEFEKSNQVSITGAPQGVARAQRQIRELLPISFAFLIREEHYTTAMEHHPGEAHPALRPLYRQYHEKLQNEFNVTIMVLPIPQILTALVTVRGRHVNISRIKMATGKLMSNLLPGCPPAVVYLGIEVSPHHLDFVKGHNGCNITQLLRETNTELKSPDVQTGRHLIPTLRISGQIDNVYRAWIKFMDLLPLALLVDIPASSISGIDADLANRISKDAFGSPAATDSDSFFSRMNATPTALGAYNIDDVASKLNDLLYNFDISLTTRQKNREVSQWLLVIKGPEKNVKLMFEIYEALKVDDPITRIRSRLSLYSSGNVSPSTPSLSGKSAYASPSTNDFSMSMNPNGRTNLSSSIGPESKFSSLYNTPPNPVWNSDDGYALGSNSPLSPFMDRLTLSPTRSYSDSKSRSFENSLVSPYGAPLTPKASANRPISHFPNRMSMAPRTLFPKEKVESSFDDRFISNLLSEPPTNGHSPMRNFKYDATVGTPTREFSHFQMSSLGDSPRFWQGESQAFTNDNGLFKNATPLPESGVRYKYSDSTPFGWSPGVNYSSGTDAQGTHDQSCHRLFGTEFPEPSFR